MTKRVGQNRMAGLINIAQAAKVGRGVVKSKGEISQVRWVKEFKRANKKQLGGVAQCGCRRPNSIYHGDAIATNMCLARPMPDVEALEIHCCFVVYLQVVFRTHHIFKTSWNKSGRGAKSIGVAFQCTNSKS